MGSTHHRMTHHYRNFTVFPSKTSTLRVSDTSELRHASITVPKITPEDKVINTIAKLKSELASIPVLDKNNQIEAIVNLRNLFSKHSKSDAPNRTLIKFQLNLRKLVMNLQGCQQ